MDPLELELQGVVRLHVGAGIYTSEEQVQQFACISFGGVRRKTMRSTQKACGKSVEQVSNFWDGRVVFSGQKVQRRVGIGSDFLLDPRICSFRNVCAIY